MDQRQESLLATASQPLNPLAESTEPKLWESSLTPAEKNPPHSHRDYQLIPAKDEDIKKIMGFYQYHAIEKYDIQSIEIVYNGYTEKAFQSHMRKLQKREGNPAFVAKWEKEATTVEEKAWRKAVIGKWKSLSQQDITCPQVNLLPFWHGTNPAILGSIFETGYANLATTDSGFFGKGLYFTQEPLYAYRVYSHGEQKKQGSLGTGGILLFNWVATYSVYPVIGGDMPKLKEKSNFQNYDAHFIPVVPKSATDPQEKNYYPCKTPQEPAVYHELVVFESAAALPRYLVTLQATLKSTLGNTLVNPMLLYQQGMAYKKGISVSQDFEKAFKCFDAAAKLNFPLGQLELGWCYRKGEGVAKDLTLAVTYFNLAQQAGLACAMHELGWCYRRGEGVLKDTVKAAAQFELAADKGVAASAFDIACCYYTGNGVKQNRPKAAFYFKQAADKGMLQAQLRLAACCASGDGTPKNLDKAIKYYRLAAEQGDNHAKEQLHTLLNAQLSRLHGQNPHLFLAQRQQVPADLPKEPRFIEEQPDEKKYSLS